MDRENADSLRALLGKGIDWPRLIRMAFRGRMMPLLYRHLSSTCAEAVAPRILEDLRVYFQNNVKRNLFLSGELLRVLRLFRAHQIGAIPFKGLALASSVYGNIALRQFDDLDILVRRGDLSRASTRLVSEGYEPQFQLSGAGEKIFFESQCQHLFERAECGTIIELHWAITPRFFSFPLDAESLWPRAKPNSLSGDPVLGFSPEDLLLILCVHGAKHMWERLLWLCDIAELIRAHRAMCWERLMDQALQLGAARMLRLGLFLTADLLGADLPEKVSRTISTDRSIRALAGRARNELFKDRVERPGVAESWLFRLKVRERLRDRVAYSLRYALVPTSGDWALFSVSASFSFVHYLLRPFRVLAKYGLGRGKRPSGLDLGRYDPTPMEIIERTLELAQVGSEDVVYDLGCGDGRIVIAAARRYGARGVGIDIHPERVAEANLEARKAGVEDLVHFTWQDAKEADLSAATVVILYLPWVGHLALGRILQEKLRPGTRIVARGSGIGEWPPEKTERVTDNEGRTHALFLWRTGGQEERVPIGIGEAIDSH